MLETIDRTIGAYRDGLNRSSSEIPVADHPQATQSWKQVQEKFKSHPVVWIGSMLAAAFLAGWAAHAKYGAGVDRLLPPDRMEREASPTPAISGK